MSHFDVLFYIDRERDMYIYIYICCCTLYRLKVVLLFLSSFFMEVVLLCILRGGGVLFSISWPLGWPHSVFKH